MATKTLVTTEDDLDGSSSAETVSFGLDNRSYEIDLSPANKAKLEHALAPYIAAGRTVSVGGRVPTQKRAGGSGMDSEQLRAVREWAASQGIEIAVRGRIAASVIDAYKAAH
jgi:hypothetical protein